MATFTRSVCLFALLVLAGVFVSAKDTPRAPVVEIQPENVDLPPGEPLSARALVTKPVSMTGVTSWSLESRRHRGAIWCQALSPDGKLLATGGLDGTVRIWDVETGKLRRALIGHNSYVSGLDFSPDGNTLASAGTFDATVRLWDMRTGRPLRVLRGHPNAAAQVKWSPDGRSVITAGGESGTITSWKAVSGIKQGTLELGRPVLGISWQPDGTSAAIAVQARPLQIWSFEKNKVTRVLGNPSDVFNCVAWGPDGKTLAAGTGKNTLLFDGASGKILHTLEVPSYALTWNREGTQLATLASDSIKLWDPGSGAPGETIPVAGANTFAGTADFTSFVSGTYVSFAVHETESGKTLRRFDNLSGTIPPLCWYRKALFTGVGLTKLSVWDSDTGKLLHTLEGHTAGITALAVAPNGKTVATAAVDKTVRLWDIATGKPTQTFTEHTAPVLAVDFSFDGKLVASGGSDKQVLVWEAASGKLLHTLTGTDTDVTAIVWKPGSSAFLASNGFERSARIWNVRTGKGEKMAGGHDIVSLAWSPDTTRVALGQYNSLVQVGQTASGKPLHTLEDAGSPPQVSSLAWSPSGQILASGRGNHTMQLWDPRSGKKLFSLATMAPVQRVSWIGGSVAVSSHDRTLRFFDAQTGKLRALVLAEDDQLLALSFDGHHRAPDAERELVYVVQTRTSQETYTPSQFVTKHKFKNVPAKVNLFAK